MEFLVIFICLFIERYLGSQESLRRFGWFSGFAGWLRGKLPQREEWQNTLALFLAVALPLLLVQLTDSLLTELWGLFGFLFALLAVLYSMGPRDLEAEVEAFLDAHERGDDESAYWHAQGLLGSEQPESGTQLTQCMMENILVAAHERVLAVIFWFVVLGPVGALLYRFSELLACQQREDEGAYGMAARRLHFIVAWVPARLTALSYAMAGSFVDSLHLWRDHGAGADEPVGASNRRVLIHAGLGALQHELEGDEAGEFESDMVIERVRATMALVRRAVLLWLALLAVYTLTGWGG